MAGLVPGSLPRLDELLQADFSLITGGMPAPAHSYSMSRATYPFVAKGCYGLSDGWFCQARQIHRLTWRTRSEATRTVVSDVRASRIKSVLRGGADLLSCHHGPKQGGRE